MTGKPEPAPPEAPFFGAITGARPVHSVEQPAIHGASPADIDSGEPEVENNLSAHICPLCQSRLTDEHGILVCHGRCGARWIEDIPGRLVDVAALAYGICACCPRPRPLVRAEHGAVCPASGNEYVLLAEGPRLLSDAAPLGFCLCCAPAAPLIYRDGVLVCQSKPSSRYGLISGKPRLVRPPDAAETLAAINAALRRNAANVTVNGLFLFDD